MLAGLAAFGVLSACSPANDVPAADAGVRAFHAQLNAGNLDAIYATSSADMKTASTEVGLVQFLGAVRRKLGDFQSGQTRGWNDNVTTGGHFVYVSYAAKYARGDADENFTFRLQGGRALLAGYHISSNALILN